VSAPLVVNTKDGACWARHTVTEGGIALYALADVCKCPEFVMATLAELTVRGIVGSADALPVPVGPEPPVDADRAKAPWGRGKDGRPLLPMGAHWTDVPELVDRHLAGIQARVDQAQPGSWFVSPTAVAPGTVCTQYEGYTRTVGRFTNVLPADLELVLHAHSDLRWCLDLVAKLRARVAELEVAQKPSESYPPALPWARLMDHEDLADFLDELAASAITHAAVEEALGEVEATCGRWQAIAEAQHAHNIAPGPDAESDGITRRIAPVQALREDEPAMGGREEWCTGCNTDHAPDECGYRPKAGDA
jgi:hypothetical protein